jgi:hypothetical protein
MKSPRAHSLTWLSFLLGSSMVVTIMLSAIAMAGQQRNLDQDTCAGMGARYGSPAHTACMLQQQRRRDNKMVLFLEEQRMHQELGRPAREKLEQKRRRRALEKWREGRQD